MKKKLTLEQVKDKALRLIEFRSHSEKELREKLKHAGAEAEDIDSVVEFMLHYHFLDDQSYAWRLAQDLKNLKKFGNQRIVQELRRKGISEEYIEEAVSELQDEEEVLLPMVEKRLQGSFEKKSIDRVLRYFVSHGYQIRDILRCVEQIKEKEESDGL